MPLRLSLPFIVRKLMLLTILINSFSFVHASQGTVTLSPNAIWDQSGTTVAGISNGSAGSSIDSLNHPVGITISNDDILYIVDYNNSRVLSVNLKSPTKKTILGTGYGDGPSQYRSPNDVYVTESDVHVLDTLNYRIQKWSTNSTTATTLPGANTFGISFSFFIDKNDYVYISLVNDNKIIRFAPDSSISTIVAGTGVVGNTPTQLYGPHGIFVDENLTIYIADRFNNRIQKWNYGASYGLTVAGNGIRGISLSQLYWPTALIVDTNSYMYIVDSFNYRILRWGPNSIAGVCIAGCTGTSGTRSYQFKFPLELAFDSNGSLYVSDANNNRVQKFQVLNNYLGPSTTSTTSTTESTTSATTTTTKSTTSATTTTTSMTTSTTSTTTTTTSTTTTMTGTAAITTVTNITLFASELLILIMSMYQVY